MKVFYETFWYHGDVSSPTDMVIKQVEDATNFADRVNTVGYVINITETHSKDHFRVTVWYKAPYKLET